MNKMSDAKVIYTVKRQDGTQMESLENAIKEAVDAGNKDIVLDMIDTVYISSATLRILLKTQKGLSAKGGKLTLKHVSESVLEVLDLVGFTGILTIEDDE